MMWDAPLVSRRSKGISREDAHLFREAVKDARPLVQERTTPHHRRPRPVPQQRLADERRVVDEMLSEPIDTAELETGDELLFARAGLQHSVLRKLRRGQFSIGAELDLHGLTVTESRTALVEFLHACRERNIRCVRIIHGKGNRSLHREPVLKIRVNHWLRQRDEVLAFCSARPVDGGTGAIYVLLRR